MHRNMYTTQTRPISPFHERQTAHKLRLQRIVADSTTWERAASRRALQLFHDMAQSVPAYSDFLQKNGIDPRYVTEPDDLSYIPPIDKDNYLRAYPTHMLCWNGTFGDASWVISTTSGSSGEPYYFPRQTQQDEQYAVTAEQYLLSNFNIDQHKTLYVVGFPMGAWIGGVFTYEAIKRVADKGYDLSIITPGIHKRGIIDAIKQLQRSFSQIILGVYPPFLRDILEDGEAAGIDWKSLNVKFIFSAEAFSESFRDYVAKKAGLKNIYKDTLNHYGTVDLGTQAHETPLSVLLRRKLFAENKQRILFPEEHKQPTFCQYDPTTFYFEEVNQSLYCSAYSGIPLFRYDLKDYGGVIGYNTAADTLKTHGIDIDAELSANSLTETHWRLPFLYIYERTDFSVSYFSINIYPDPIRKALLLPEYHASLTGKFSMKATYNDAGEQRLEIYVESRSTLPGSSSKLASHIREDTHQALMRESTEYPEVFRMYGERAKPVVILKPYEDDELFKPGTKQKWALK